MKPHLNLERLCIFLKVPPSLHFFPSTSFQDWLLNQRNQSGFNWINEEIKNTKAPVPPFETPDLLQSHPDLQYPEELNWKSYEGFCFIKGREEGENKNKTKNVLKKINSSPCSPSLPTHLITVRSLGCFLDTVLYISNMLYWLLLRFETLHILPSCYGRWGLSSLT